METQQTLIKTTKCTKRKFSDHTIDNALYNIRNKKLVKDYELEKKRCLECKAWHIIRIKRIK